MKIKTTISLFALFIIMFSFSNISYGQTEVDTGRTDYSSQEFENMIPANSCDCIAFRFDDIQNGWLLDVQLEVVNKFREKNIPLTIGIIGHELEGNVANYVKEITNENNSTIETANHGWLHEDFTILDKKTQDQLMKKTNKKIFDVTGKSSKIFVPPFNVFNNDTIEVMKENNFTGFSSNVFNSKPPYPLVNSDLYNFPETSTTGTINPELRLFEGLSHTETLKDIQASQNIFGFSVVTLHPQEFAMITNGTYSNHIDKNQIHELDLLIDEVKKSNLKIVFLSQINENVIEPLEIKEIESSPEPETQTQIDPPSLELDAGPSDESQKIPDWIKINAGWWASDLISESEFLRAIEYLIENEIMKISITENEDLPSITTTYSLPSSRATEYVEITGSFTEKHEGALTLTIVRPDKTKEKLTTYSRDGFFMTTMALTSESSQGTYNVFAEIKGDQILVSTFNVKGADSGKVPEWIKNNADWWSQGLISDDDFVKGIQYLVEKRIIEV